VSCPRPAKDLSLNVSPFEAYRQQIESLLANTEQLLTESERDSLRMALAGARKNGVPLMLASPGLMPRGINLGDRILAQLEKADQELAPHQVNDLERLIEERLPNIQCPTI
jgi:hypothetical protein